MFERFRYCGLGIMNYGCDKVTDDVVREFLDKGVSSVDIDAGCWMYLTRGDEILTVWCTNTWYAFGADFLHVVNSENHEKGSFDWAMLSYLPEMYGKCLYKAKAVRPRFKTLLRLKKLYLEATK